MRGVLLVLLVVLLVMYSTAAHWYTEWLWFGEVHYRSVFWVPFLSGAAVGTAAALGVFIILFANILPLVRLRPMPRLIDLRPVGGRVYRPFARLSPLRLAAAAVGIVSVLAGAGAAASWPTFQTFLHQVPFGVRDPIFGRDVAFYVFSLPAYQAVYDWLFLWLFIALLVAAAGYYLDLAPLAMRGVWAIPPGVRVHLSILTGLLLLLKAGGFWLDAYRILFSPHGAVYGAGYTVLHATLPVLRVLSVLAAASGVLVLATIRTRSLRPAVGTLVVFVAVWIAGLGFYPAFIQQVVVAPNELDREAPYIRSSIQATLRAYNLDQVEEKAFPATVSLTPDLLRVNRTVLDNIRLWDHRPLLLTYNQLQGLRLYYAFTRVGIDRYRVGGSERQVMLSARELDIARLTARARTWVNDHLVYTHGYGLVMSPVNVIASEGLPDFWMKDIPPQSPIGLDITRPEVYYGLVNTPYVIVNTRTKELDYAQGDQDVYTTYQGTGGVPLAGSARFAFASRLGAMQILLSSDVTSRSRIMFYRAVPERVAHIAPFLTFDNDPYLVLAEGRLYWLVDAYTTSAGYPYSRPSGDLNYIRNSVKVVVDAYNGTTRFYVVDPADPLIRTYARIFPGLFVFPDPSRPFASMPQALVPHLRYPVDLFTIQAQVYATFHMKDPRVFYNREDLWAVPNELFEGTPQPLEPYYVNLRLTPGSGEEFALIQPFTPSGKDNMVAWMAGRSDVPNYGRLLVYRFPKDRTVYGPMQIEARINQDPVISAQLTLWNQQGSRVIRGNLLVIPVADALLYIEPLYLQAEGSALPELKRVIVSYGSQIAMEPTLEEALGRIFGILPPRPGERLPGGPETVSPAPPAPSRGPSRDRISALVAEANSHYTRAQAALRAGDFAAYGREIDALGRVLRELGQATGGP
jgi:uncharacterized protein